MSTVPTVAAHAEVARYRHGRVPRAVRERQVIEAAEHLFAEQGFAAASMDELSRRVGVSKPVVYALVGSKEELFRRCAERMSGTLAQRVTAAVASAGEPRAQMEAAILAFFRFVADQPRLWEVLAFDTGPFTADVAAIRRNQNLLVAGLLVAAAQRGGAAADPLRASALASAVNGAVEALARWWHDHEDVAPEELTSLAVRLLLPGLEQLLAAERRAHGTGAILRR